jgi:hypothetical protein
MSGRHVEADGSWCIRDSLGAAQPLFGQALLTNFSGPLTLATPVLVAKVVCAGRYV